MNKICTSIEQSQRLIELGIDVETADMIYQPTMDVDSMNNVGFAKIPLCFQFNEVKEFNIQYLPAWSLTALLQLMPKSICIKQSEHSGYFYFLEWQFANDNSLRYVGNDRKCLIDIYSDHDVALKDDIDTAFEMICWLKENKKI